MSIVDRARNICLTPKTEWPVIASETTPTGELITGYVLPLAAIGAVAGFIGSSLVGMSLPFVGHYRVPMVTGLTTAVFTLVMAVAVCVVMGLVVNALAPTFSAEKNSAQALKVVVYSYTPAWLAGVLQILPVLGVLGILAGLYGIYLLYLGLPKLMKCPEDKAVGYTVVTVLCAIVLSVVLGLVTATIIGAGAMGSAMMGQGSAAQSGFDPDSPMGRLQDLGRQMERSAAKAEEAARTGDTEGQVAAAREGLGALLGGGRRVEPLDIEALKAFVPATLAGLPQTDSRAERTGMAGLMISKAEATYSDGAGRDLNLEITDSGGMSGLMGLAGWVGVRGEREDASGSERTYMQDGRLTHERVSKTGGQNEFGVVLGDRFMVSLKSGSLDLAAIKAAAATMDLARLESLKDTGVQR